MGHSKCRGRLLVELMLLIWAGSLTEVAAGQRPKAVTRPVDNAACRDIGHDSGNIRTTASDGNHRCRAGPKLLGCL